MKQTKIEHEGRAWFPGVPPVHDLIQIEGRRATVQVATCGRGVGYLINELGELVAKYPSPEAAVTEARALVDFPDEPVKAPSSTSSPAPSSSSPAAKPKSKPKRKVKK